MTSAQVVQTSVNVTNNSPPRDYSHPDEQTTQTIVLIVLQNTRLQCNNTHNALPSLFRSQTAIYRTTKQEKQVDHHLVAPIRLCGPPALAPFCFAPPAILDVCFYDGFYDAERKVNPVSAYLSNIVNFLADQFQQRKDYRILNVYQSAISMTHPEMPTSGDLKSGDFSFFPHPKKIELGLPMFT